MFSDERLNIESLAPLIRDEILKAKKFGDFFDINEIKSGLLRIEETNESFGNTEFVMQIRKLISNVVETGGDNSSTNSDVSMSSIMQRKGLEPLRSKIKSTIASSLRDVTPETIGSSLKAKGKSKGNSNSFSFFNFDDLPEFESLDGIISLLSTENFDVSPLEKLLKVEIDDLLEHPLWHELLKSLFAKLVSRKSEFSYRVLLYRVYFKLCSQLKGSPTQIVELMCSLMIYFASIYCSYDPKSELISSSSLEHLIGVLQREEELRFHVALLHLILSTSADYLESPGSKKDGDIIVYLGFQILASGYISSVRTYLDELYLPYLMLIMQTYLSQVNRISIFELLLVFRVFNSDENYMKHLYQRWSHSSILLHGLYSGFYTRLMQFIEFSIASLLSNNNMTDIDVNNNSHLFAEAVQSLMYFILPFASNIEVLQYLNTNKVCSILIVSDESKFENYDDALNHVSAQFTPVINKKINSLASIDINHFIKLFGSTSPHLGLLNFDLELLEILKCVFSSQVMDTLSKTMFVETLQAVMSNLNFRTSYSFDLSVSIIEIVTTLFNSNILSGRKYISAVSEIIMSSMTNISTSHRFLFGSSEFSEALFKVWSIVLKETIYSKEESCGLFNYEKTVNYLCFFIDFFKFDQRLKQISVSEMIFHFLGYLEECLDKNSNAQCENPSSSLDKNLNSNAHHMILKILTAGNGVVLDMLKDKCHKIVSKIIDHHHIFFDDKGVNSFEELIANCLLKNIFSLDDLLHRLDWDRLLMFPYHLKIICSNLIFLNRSDMAWVLVKTLCQKHVSNFPTANLCFSDFMSRVRNGFLETIYNDNYELSMLLMSLIVIFFQDHGLVLNPEMSRTRKRSISECDNCLESSSCDYINEYSIFMTLLEYHSSSFIYSPFLEFCENPFKYSEWMMSRSFTNPAYIKCPSFIWELQDSVGNLLFPLPSLNTNYCTQFISDSFLNWVGSNEQLHSVSDECILGIDCNSLLWYAQRFGIISDQEICRRNFVLSLSSLNLGNGNNAESCEISWFHISLLFLCCRADGILDCASFSSMASRFSKSILRDITAKAIHQLSEESTSCTDKLSAKGIAYPFLIYKIVNSWFFGFLPMELVLLLTYLEMSRPESCGNVSGMVAASIVRYLSCQMESVSTLSRRYESSVEEIWKYCPLQMEISHEIIVCCMNT